MLEFTGKYNTAKVFTDTADNETISQIINLLNHEFIKDSKIRIMPDTHAGAGCTIGTTLTITDKIVPNLVGVDIGCGMETILLKDTHIELESLDKAIKSKVPAGFNIRSKPHSMLSNVNIENLRCKKSVNLNRAELSLGSIGGGNHFLEIDKDDEGRLYLIIHSGSRHLGKQVAEYYQNAAYDQMKAGSKANQKLISELKSAGREKDIQKELKKIKHPHIDKALAYAEGSLFDDYLHDMAIAQEYATWNRKAIAKEIMDAMKFREETRYTTIHNYIDMKSKILRKGAISAQDGEICLIPINMRDGSLLCKGKGNPDWNYSAPHGAGRLMSRSQAKERITLSDFKKSMEGIYSTTVNKSTLDESAFAYKPMDEIILNIGDTVEILKIMKPIYNFKASE